MLGLKLRASLVLFGCSSWQGPVTKAPSTEHAALSSPSPGAKTLTPEQALAAAKDALAATRYSDAARYYAQAEAVPQFRQQAQNGIARVGVATGKYLEVTRLADDATLSVSLRCERALLKAQALRALGELEPALSLLAPWAGALEPPKALVQECETLSVEAGEIGLELGRRGDAEKALMRLVDAYNEGKVAEDDAERLALVARAAQLLRSAEDANEAFNQAEQAGTLSPKALLWRALFHFEHNDLEQAAELVEEALQQAPEDVNALALSARIRVDQALDFDAAERLARQALKVNPQAVSARAVLAGLRLRDMNLAGARREIDEGLKVNPRDLVLHSLKGAAALLDADQAGLEAAERRVLELNPSYSGFYDIVGTYAEWEHRYADIVALMQRAVRVDVGDARAWAQLGVNQLRNGERAEGTAALETAFRLDPYNTRAHNTLKLERVVQSAYESREVGPFRLLLPKASAALLSRYLPGLLMEAFGKLQEYYQFTPSKPIGIEIYRERTEFAVRTSGLPDTAISGVCFGKVLATVASEREPFNLPMTLWHELSHVFHIQMSQSRVPRWFTEGLAEYETEVRNPYWQRELDAELYEAHRDGRIPRLNDLNQAFTHAEDLEDVGVAYYASTQMLRMLVEQFGRARVREMLLLWGQGLALEEVVKQGLGVTSQEVDRRFHEFLDARLKRYAGQFVPKRRVGDPELVLKNARANKQSPTALVRLGMLGYSRGEFEAAGKAVQAALALAPMNPDALWLQGRIAVKKGDGITTLTNVGKLIGLGQDGYETQALLGRGELLAGNQDMAIEALQRAQAFDPTRREGIEGLYRTARESKPEVARLALVELVKLDEHDAKQAVALARAYLSEGNVKEALAIAKEAVMAGLQDGDAHRTLAEALERSGKAREAQFEQDSAELCGGSPEEREAVLTWGLEFWRRQGVASKVKRARSELEALRGGRSEFED